MDIISSISSALAPYLGDKTGIVIMVLMFAIGCFLFKYAMRLAILVAVVGILCGGTAYSGQLSILLQQLISFMVSVKNIILGQILHQ